MFNFNDYDAFFVTHKENKRYLTGFTGSECLVLATKEGTVLITDGRYNTQTKQEVYSDVKVIITDTGVSHLEEALKILSSDDIKRIAIESNSITVATLDDIDSKLSNKEFVRTSAVIEKKRLIKTDEEVANIKKAIELTDKVFAFVCENIKPGMTEKEVKLMVDTKHVEFGAQGPSFDTIVASGPNSAKPHAQPSDRVIEEGDIVTIDNGCFYNGYVSDMTRTFFVGEPKDEKLIEIHNVVHEAFSAQLEQIKPGMTGIEADKIGRDIIEAHGYGEYFIHGTGHGIGLEIHEAPRLSLVDPTVLEPGMTVTVEPGIYIEGIGGVRIENDILITETGIESLNSSPTSYKIK